MIVTKRSIGKKGFIFAVKSKKKIETGGKNEENLLRIYKDQNVHEAGFVFIEFYCHISADCKI